MYTVHILNFCVCVCRYKKTARFDVYDLLHAPSRSHKHGQFRAKLWHTVQHFIGPGAPVPSVEDMSPLLNKSQQLQTRPVYHCNTASSGFVFSSGKSIKIIYTWWILIFGYFWWSFRSAIWPFMAPRGSGVSMLFVNFSVEESVWSLWIRWIRAARHPAFSGAVGPHLRHG